MGGWGWGGEVTWKYEGKVSKKMVLKEEHSLAGSTWAWNSKGKLSERAVPKDGWSLLEGSVQFCSLTDCVFEGT